jgi:hypothetical protein
VVLKSVHTKEGTIESILPSNETSPCSIQETEIYLRLADVTLWLCHCLSKSYPCWMHDVENNIKCFGVTGYPRGIDRERTLNSKQNCVWRQRNGYATIPLYTYIRTDPSLCESTVVRVYCMRELRMELGRIFCVKERKRTIFRLLIKLMRHFMF